MNGRNAFQKECFPITSQVTVGNGVLAAFSGVTFVCVGVHKDKQTCKKFRNSPFSFATKFQKKENSVFGGRKMIKREFSFFFHNENKIVYT